MSFLRKLFGAKPPLHPTAADREPTTDSTHSRLPSAPAGTPHVQPIAPRPATLADQSPRPLHSYFEYVGGGSSKFYAVSLEEEDGGTWRVRVNFGRIGFPRAWDSRVVGAAWPKAAATYLGLISEKTGKGYELRSWPATLTLPGGLALEDDPAEADESRHVLYRSATRGTLPPATGGTIADVRLPAGVLYAPEPDGGPRGTDPRIWASAQPVSNVGKVWSRLAAAFSETGIWPFVIDATYGFRGFDDYLMDVPRRRHTDVHAILRKGWNDSVSLDVDRPDDHLAPFGRKFPGLADPTPGDRPGFIDRIVASTTGHLGLVAVHRPADILDAVGWMGAVNSDGDPLDMSTVLRSWERRFDAYVVGMGTDTLTLAVGRPPRDFASATAIAAEHFAFCPDNIEQGPGSIRDYASSLVRAELWPFWWD